jgi:CheY-like chemotaxis protein
VSSPAQKDTSAETVLVVEDEVLIRLSIAEYLRDCGYRVLEAGSAEEATTILQKSDLQLDVVLSGIKMPGRMNGFALAQRARELRPGLKVILAGTAERAAHEAADLCEDGPMLMKPYDPQIVLDHIKRLLAARDREGNG